MTTQTIKSFWQEEAGQDLVEYSLLLGFLALGSLALLSSAGASVKSIWSNISTNLTTAAATPEARSPRSGLAGSRAGGALFYLQQHLPINLPRKHNYVSTSHLSAHICRDRRRGFECRSLPGSNRFRTKPA